MIEVVHVVGLWLLLGLAGVIQLATIVATIGLIVMIIQDWF